MRKLLALLLMAPCALLAQVPDYVPTDGLVAYWPLDGNGLDQSGSGHHLTETNIQSGSDRYGAAESAVAFNGEDSHLTLDAFDLNQTGSFSVGFWAQMNPSAFTEPQCLFYEGIDGEFHFTNADPGVVFTQFHWAAKANSSAWYGPAAGPLSSGEWNHFVGTYDEGSLELFVNGVSVATQQAACCSQAPTDQLVLGARRVTSFVEHPFSGALDEVALWNRVLTFQEVTGLYESSITEGPCFDFSEFPGQVHLDNGPVTLQLGPGESSPQADSNGVVVIDEPGLFILERSIEDAHLSLIQDSSWVEFGDILNDLTPPVSFSFDARLTGNGGPILATDNGNPSYYNGYWMSLNANVIDCSFGDGGWHGGGERRTGRIYSEFTQNEWYHVTCVVNGANDFTFFLDGVEQPTNYDDAGTGGSVNFTSDPMKLGHWNAASPGTGARYDQCFTGDLNNVTVWHRALDGAEAIALQEGGLPGDLTGLVAHWDFDGTTNGLVLDGSGLGHDGLLMGNATINSQSLCSRTDTIEVHDPIQPDDCEDSIELLIVGAHGEETATREALEAYQLDSTLTDRDLSITEVDFQDSISPCGQWDTLLENKDAVLFLGTANLNNCSWEDMIPVLDSFMRAGGEVYLQAENSYGMVTRFDGNGSTWPADWSDHLTEAEAANWFGTAFTAEQPWCCGMGSINLNCINNTDVLGIEHDCNPLFFGAYESAESCITHFQEPWLYEVADGDLDSENFFSVFHFGGDHNSSNPANVLTGNHMVFGLHFGEGHLIVFGDNRPGFAGGETRFLLGNLIHGLSHPESLPDLIAPDSDCVGTSATIGCTNPAACNYDPAATEDDGSCQLPPTIGWSSDTSICTLPFVLDAGPGFDAYLWNTGDTTQTITDFQEGQYSVEVTETGTADFHSLQFDGVDDYVDIPDIDITGSGPFTLCASARLLGETGTDFYNILSSGENGPEQLQWGINNNDLRMAFYHSDFSPIESNVSIERFEWNHIAVVYDGTDLMLYLNAEEVQRQSVTLTLTQSVRFIGQWQVDSDIIAAREPWHGQLDHVGIWNTALSQDQIAEQMSCPSSPEPDGLMAHWNFETDAGNALSDNGSVVTSGTIVGTEYATLTPEHLCTGCSSTASTNVTVDFDCLYCGEGTEWDEQTQQCIAMNNGPMPSCGDGTVWDPVEEECIVAIPTDTDFDGCVSASDILNLLGTFGTCPPIPE